MKVEVATPKFPEPIFVTSPLREKYEGEKVASPRDGQKKENANDKDKNERGKEKEKGKEEEKEEEKEEVKVSNTPDDGGNGVLGDLDWGKMME